ncbi:uncharacterized protein GGS22DRAFT_188493 [Annulohypoxylon maeteangense]|uniref:uncharacterized protein n=1 Tax=Annulohypoxylon maeteangense TaxID=1927788 RepID=UPI0020080AF2|nr:uncharacterized protein GGS22DRAFT_188493 [Annulohypoxylon maeteangense]KAI0885203.1 hypothetical protein GGS22DRAFT_188493 [Annulohypoxylon maeteangense]
MDDHGRRRRPNEPPINAPSNNPRYPVHDPNAQGRSYGASGSDRYRPAPLNTSPTATRGIGGAATYSGYYQEPAAAFSTAMQPNTMTYQPEYGQDTRQTQSFSTYNTPMMYNVPQASAQSAVYDTSQQFPSRQPAALQMIQTDVATPYFPSEPTNAAAASNLQSHASTSSTSAVYQQSPASQRTMLQNYPSGMTSMSGMAQTSTSDQAMEEPDYSQTTEMTEAYEHYQAALREVFTNIRSGVLQAASESLLNISEWLLSKVVELGLAADDENLYRDRIKMWQDFNHAWLSLFQKQKDLMGTGLQLQRGQTLISEDGLRKMGKEIVRLCDGIDRHGLVDYEYGVWEENIVAIIEECLDLYENEEEAEPGSSSVANPAGPSHHGHHTSR